MSAPPPTTNSAYFHGGQRKEAPASAVVTDDGAMSKRRAALLKLKQRQSQPPMGGDLMARAKSQLQSSSARPNPPPPMRGSGRQRQEQPPIPQPDPMHQSRRRSSDIFPGVEKVAAATVSAQPPQQQQQHPLQGRGGAAAAPPPAPGVARRLDPTFAADKQRGPQQPPSSRSKSAPPSRPPPPSPDAKAQASPSKEAPERTRPPPPVRTGAAGAPPPPKPNVQQQVVNSTAKPPPPSQPSPTGAVPPPTGPKSPRPPPSAKPPSSSPEKKPAPPPLAAVQDEKKKPPPQQKQPNNPQPSSGPPPSGPPPIPQQPPRPLTKTNKGDPPLLGSVIGGGPPQPAGKTGIKPPVQPMPGKTTVGLSQSKGGESTQKGMVPVSKPPPGAADPRDAMLRTLREEAATPPIENKPSRSIELRMQMELNRVEKDKGDALRKVAELQKEIIDLKEAQEASEDLHALIELANTKGEKSAMQWARQRASVKGGSGKQASFLARMTSGAAPASPHRRRSIPRPKPKHQQLDPALVKQAVEQVEHEYVADLATYIIRRPFGMAIAERDFWMAAGQLNAKGYEKRSSAEKPASLEVAARINADGSLLVVHDEAMTRHQNKQGHWEDFGNVFQREVLLGTVSFVDKDANEKDYSLDEVFEGARAVREHYCHAVVSTAAGLKANAATPAAAAPPAPQLQQAAPAKKVATSDASVGTEDLPKPLGEKAAHKEENPKKKELPPPDDSSDVLTVFFGMFTNSILAFLQFVFIGIPLRIMTFFIVFGAAVLLLCLARLYMMDEYGAAALGGSVNIMYNQPGIM